jgi:UDP-GlcNAc:undecaprenyl-phosphate GlcNAc-1-phosphate transferase
VVFALALGLAAAATPLAGRLAVRLRVVDRPEPRKLHTRPIPLLGGVAIWVAVLGALLVYPDRTELRQLGGLLIGATWISFWGLWDDHRRLRPAWKLAGQLVALVPILATGVAVALPVPSWVNLTLTVLWVLGITNAMNLLDNMDGLAGGVGAVAAAWFLLLAALNGQFLVGALAAALLGACLGFLLQNFDPARIFMGDSGSLFLGFLLACLGIKLRFPTNVPWVTWMVPLMVLAVPIFDTTLVVVARLRRGVNPFTTPGQDHVSHRLVVLGWTRREAVLLLYLVGCALGGVALFVSVARAAEAYLFAVATLLVGAGAILWLLRKC